MEKATRATGVAIRQQKSKLDQAASMKRPDSLNNPGHALATLPALRGKAHNSAKLLPYRTRYKTPPTSTTNAATLLPRFFKRVPTTLFHLFIC